MPGIRCVLALLAGTVLAAPGCTVVTKTTDAVGEATADAVVGDQSGSGMMSSHGYSMQLFRAMFYQGGYVLETEGFEPGEFVQWRVSGEGDTQWFRKALLKREGDGSEWWRLTSQTGDTRVVMEALIEPPDANGDRRIVRLRQQFGADAQPEEVPVTKQDADKWTLNQQRRLTDASYEGMRVGTTDVRVPAGTFRAEHLRGSHAQRGGTANWYLSDRVPGGVVKFAWSSGDTRRTLALSDYGGGMTSSRLGSF